MPLNRTIKLSNEKLFELRDGEWLSEKNLQLQVAHEMDFLKCRNANIS